MRALFASLTSRLVLTTVALVVLVAVLIGVAATAALNAQLTRQLDDDLRAVAGVHPHADRDGPGQPPPGTGVDAPEGGPESLQAILTDTGSRGSVSHGRQDLAPLSDDVLEQLADIPVDGQVHEVDLTGLGSYHVIAVDRPLGTEVTGLPTEQVEESVRALVGWEALLIALGALLALGGG